MPHLARLQAEARGKTRITIILDNDLLMTFRAKAESGGTGYQTLIIHALRRAAGIVTVDEETLRRVIREELKASLDRIVASGALTSMKLAPGGFPPGHSCQVRYRPA